MSSFQNQRNKKLRVIEVMIYITGDLMHRFYIGSFHMNCYCNHLSFSYRRIIHMKAADRNWRLCNASKIYFPQHFYFNVLKNWNVILRFVL